MAQVTIEQAFQTALQQHQAGQFAQAESLYRQILVQQPNHAEALHLLGVLAYQMGRNDNAADLIKQAIALKPNFPEAYNNLGNALRGKGQLADAGAAYLQAITLAPGFLQAHNNYGNALKEMGRIDEAIAAYLRAIRLDPNYAEPHNHLGVALKEKGQLDQAVSAYRQAIAIKPRYAEAHYNLAIALGEKGQREESIAACRQAIALKPVYPEALINLGAALRDNGQFDEAIAACRQAIALKPQAPEAHLNLALALLAQGDFSQGLEEYEWRWQCQDFLSTRRNFPQPLWDGQPFGEATLLLHAEQGFGDTIHCIRYVPLVVGRGGKVIVECQAELVPLIQPLAKGCQIVAHGQPLPAFDFHCPLLSLPRAFKTRLDNIPHQVPYLHADVAAASKWRDKLAGDPNPIKVGLAWAGNKAYKNDRHRSMALSALAPLADVHGISFYSLQRKEPRGQSWIMPPGLQLIDWTEDRKDFADTAGLIANLDLVISVETSVVQLAGAMGKPVWVLLAFVPDWRWLLEREDSPWYPTMRLFRQTKIGDWDDVMRRVGQALALLAPER